MSITYRELMKRLQALPPERLDDTATIFLLDTDEFHPVHDTEIASDKQDVLDPGHFFLLV